MKNEKLVAILDMVYCDYDVHENLIFASFVIKNNTNKSRDLLIAISDLKNEAPVHIKFFSDKSVNRLDK